MSLGRCEKCGNRLGVHNHQVECDHCGQPHLKHPLQADLDRQAAIEKLPPAAPKLAPMHFETQDHDLLMALAERVSQLEAQLTEPKRGQRPKSQPAA